MNKRAIFYLVVFIIIAISVSAQTNPKWSVPISMTPPSPSVGQLTQFRATLWVKVGPVSNLKVIGGVDGAKIFEKVFPSLARQATEEVSFQWTATAGSHTAWFQLDPDETTRDENRSDNRTEMRFSVASSGGVGPTATLTKTTSLTRLTTTFTFTTLDPNIFIHPCVLSEKKDTDLFITEFSISSGNSNNERRYTVRIKNVGTKCLRLVHWAIVNSDKVIGWAPGHEIIKHGQFGPTTGNNWVMEAGEVLTASGAFNKSTLSPFSKCTNPNPAQVFIKPLVDCSHIRLMVDHLNEIFETREYNNNSVIKTIIWE